MKDKVAELLKQSVAKETKQERWAMSAAMRLLEHDCSCGGAVTDPDFYAQYGVDFAEAMATALLMGAELKELLATDQRKKATKPNDQHNVVPFIQPTPKEK